MMRPPHYFLLGFQAVCQDFVLVGCVGEVTVFGHLGYWYHGLASRRLHRIPEAFTMVVAAALARMFPLEGRSGCTE